MFGFLKRKLGDVVKKFSKGVEEESELVKSPIDEKSDEVIAEKIAERVVSKSNVVKKKEDEKKKTVKRDIDKTEKERKQILRELKSEVKKSKKQVILEEKGQKQKKEKLEQDVVADDVVADDVVADDVVADDSDLEFVEEPNKRGFFSRITDTFTKVKLSDEKFEDLFWDLEVTLLENNVAFEVIEKIKQNLKIELTQEKISRKKAHDIILDSLRKSIEDVVTMENIDLMKKIKEKKPYIIVVIGVNGSGKTTTIAKLCHYLKKQNKTVVLAAADTFRAAAIQQIEHHANNLGIKLIKHEYNSDPSAVAFDAIKHAESKGLDVVIIDTAGRLHSNDNLMNELKKLVRVNKPDLKLFVGESITGNDCVEQAKKYNEIIGIDAIILSKADIDEKGGAALSISYVTKKPVLFIGTGQNYEDLEFYDKQKILDNLGI